MLGWTSRPPAWIRAARADRVAVGPCADVLIVSTHDLHLVRELLPRTVVMDHGAIVTDGLTADILSDAALLEAPMRLEVY